MNPPTPPASPDSPTRCASGTVGPTMCPHLGRVAENVEEERVRVLPAATDLLAVERVADVESNPDRRERLPAGRIVLVRFALVEVEQLTEDDCLGSAP